MPSSTEPAILRPTPPRHGVAARDLVLPLLLGLCFVLQCVWFIRTQSFATDEPSHITAGLEILREHKFEFLNDQPPLARVLFALPVLSVHGNLDWLVTPEVMEVVRVNPTPEAVAWRARLAAVGFGVLTAWLLWIAVRAWFSMGAANFALALFAFTPSVVAHFSVAAVDGISVLMIFAAGLQLMRWWRKPDGRQTILLGFVFGLLLLAKFYTPPMFALGMLLVLILAPDKLLRNPLDWNWEQAIAVVLIAFVTVWAGYLFHVSRAEFADGTMTVHFPNRDKVWVVPVPFHAHFSLPVPAAEYLEGVWLVKEHSKWGHATYMLGRMNHSGWNVYYFVAIALKWPPIVLLLALLGVVLLLRRKLLIPRELPREWALLFLFPAVLFVMGILSRIQIGDRHVLPVYMVLLILAAAVWHLAADRRWRIVLILLALLNAADAMRYAPDYLSYFTPFVRQRNTWRYLSDSNLDWGNGLLALRDWQQQHPNEELNLAYFGSVNPAIYGIRYTKFDLNVEPSQRNPAARPTGTVAVSRMCVTGQWLRDPQAYRWLLQYRLKADLDHTIWIFEVPASAANPPSATPAQIKKSAESSAPLSR